MKIRALKNFEGIRDNERNVYPKEGDVWEVTEERAEFLKSHGVVEIIEEEKVEEPKIVGTIDFVTEDIKPEVKFKKKKTSKK